MAHLWLRDDAGWSVTPLAGNRYDLDPAAAALLLHSPYAPDDRAWMLIACSDDVRINGMPVRTGLSCVRDRDEIRVSSGARVYFSTEEQARVAPYPRADAIVCPRCKSPIDEEAPAVRCPQCKIWYHQSEDLPCYTYAPTCATCSRATDLDAGFQWTPQGL